MVSFLSQERLLTKEEISFDHDPAARGDSAKLTCLTNRRGLYQTTNPVNNTNYKPRKWMVPPAHSQADWVHFETAQGVMDRDHHDDDGGFVGSCCGWTEDDYLRNVLSWDSPEQRAYIDFLLERRAHYRMVHRLSVVSILVVAFLLGCTMLVGVLMNQLPQEPLSWASSSSSSLSHLWVGGILAVAPLVCMSWEGNHQYTIVDMEIQKWTKQRLLLIPTPPNIPYDRNIDDEYIDGGLVASRHLSTT